MPSFTVLRDNSVTITSMSSPMRIRWPFRRATMNIVAVATARAVPRAFSPHRSPVEARSRDAFAGTPLGRVHAPRTTRSAFYLDDPIAGGQKTRAGAARLTTLTLEALDGARVEKLLADGYGLLN